MAPGISGLAAAPITPQPAKGDPNTIWALITQGQVVNIVVATDSTTAASFQSYDAVVDITAMNPQPQIGWSYNAGVFTAPQPEIILPPSIVAEKGAGQGAQASLDPISTNSAGNISLTTGQGPGAGLLLTVTFSVPYDAPPIVELTPSDSVSASDLGFFVTTMPEGFTISGNGAAGAFSWSYAVVLP